MRGELFLNRKSIFTFRLVVLLVLCMIVAPAWEAYAQQGPQRALVSTSYRINHATAAVSTVNVLCGANTCPAGTYLVTFDAEIVHANSIDMTPTLSATFGWTGETGAETKAVTAAGGATTITYATTGGTFSGTAVVHTTGLLSIAVALSGSSAGMYNAEYTATRLR
jgi:hypothetical protein